MLSRLIRFAMFVVMTVVCGCASHDDQEDVGSARSASLSSYSVSTRSPVSDNTVVSTTASVGLPGVVPNTDAGVCWISKLSGSFRGLNEYAHIFVNGEGYYYAAVRSNTGYDSVTGVGPAMTMKCRHLTDFMPSGVVGDFAATDHSLSVTSASCAGPNNCTATSTATTGSLWPWAGVDGRLDSASSPSYNTSTANKTTGVLFVSVAKSCPLQSSLFCSMASSAWETYSLSGARSWSYQVSSMSAVNDADVILSNNAASSMECFIDGVNGEWNAGTSAEVLVGADNKWHLVTVRGGGGGMGARASCVNFNQGF